MQKLIIICVLSFVTPLLASAQEGMVYKWEDEHGNVFYGDSIPAEYAELPKQILNDHGVTVDILAGKKTEEQREAERLESERRVAVDLQRRADQALLATYLTVEEILMHRDRRVELFQAQSRVTELYLSNLGRRLDTLREDASNYKPYSGNSAASVIPDDLANDLKVTRETIERHERNLKKFLADEAQIIARFAGDISRFKVLKGIE
jgi:hypothetical protein